MSTIKLIRTDSANEDFKSLVGLLDAELKASDGEQHVFYSEFNKIDSIRYAVVAYADKIPVGCGAIREYTNDTAEIKRMYVKSEFRGKGIGKAVLNELEQWGLELNFPVLILETGEKQREAVGLYKKYGFELIPNYGQYVGVENSICFKKRLND